MTDRLTGIPTSCDKCGLNLHCQCLSKALLSNLPNPSDFRPEVKTVFYCEQCEKLATVEYKRGCAAERAAIIQWLRTGGKGWHVTAWDEAAEAIERGEHNE